MENVTAAPSNESPTLYSAPFLTTWLCSAATVLYLPLYVVGKVAAGGPKKSGLGLALRNGVQSFRERGFTPCEYFTRLGCCLCPKCKKETLFEKVPFFKQKTV